MRDGFPSLIMSENRIAIINRSKPNRRNRPGPNSAGENRFGNGILAMTIDSVDDQRNYGWKIAGNL